MECHQTRGISQPLPPAIISAFLINQFFRWSSMQVFRALGKIQWRRDEDYIYRIFPMISENTSCCEAGLAWYPRYVPRSWSSTLTRTGWSRLPAPSPGSPSPTGSGTPGHYTVRTYSSLVLAGINNILTLHSTGMTLPATKTTIPYLFYDKIFFHVHWVALLSVSIFLCIFGYVLTRYWIKRQSREMFWGLN